MHTERWATLSPLLDELLELSGDAREMRLYQMQGSTLHSARSMGSPSRRARGLSRTIRASGASSMNGTRCWSRSVKAAWVRFGSPCGPMACMNVALR